MFDPHKHQADFPILARKIHGDKRLVYLDNAATSQKPLSVIHAISNYYHNHNANVHRGVHELGDESTKLFHHSRNKIAQFFGALPEEFVAVRNTTEAINQIAYTWGDTHITEGDVILTTEMEHHSNLVPWQQLATRKKAILEYISVTDDGHLDTNHLSQLLQQGVRLVVLTHVSNTLGTLNRIHEITEMVHRAHPSTKILVDGAQAAPHLPIDFHDLPVDFYVVSAHKMLGPMGIGGLFVKKNIAAELPPFLFGGGMIDEVTTQYTTFAENLEERFTAGTPDVAGLVGWAAACEYLQNIGMGKLLMHDQELVKYTMTRLREFPQVHLIGPVDIHRPDFDRVGSVAFTYEGVHAHDVGQILDSEGVAVRSGHHCTMPLHTKFSWQATVRVSFQLYNTREDIDAFIDALRKVHTVFGR